MMWIKKLTILALSVIMTVPIVAAATPSVQFQKTDVIPIDRMLKECRQGYANYAAGQGAEESFSAVLDLFPKEHKAAAALICLGYSEGYVDGQRGNS